MNYYSPVPISEKNYLKLKILRYFFHCYRSLQMIQDKCGTLSKMEKIMVPLKDEHFFVKKRVLFFGNWDANSQNLEAIPI